ncbi:hypothetical protein ACUIJQ_02850 [Levilactobacillus hammesii]
MSLNQASDCLEATLHLQVAGLLAPSNQAKLDVKQVAGLEATVLREFRETYALLV